MKHEDLLEVMGEIDPQYIEDAVRGSRSPKLLLRRLSPYAGGAAAVLILGFSAFVIYGIIRDGIAQQNPPAGYTETAASLSGTELTQSAGTETGTAAVTTAPPAELPSDEFIEMTVTEPPVTTTEKVTLPVPANMEMPDAALNQSIGDRMSVNWLSESGVLAATVEDAQYYESYEDAGLEFSDLTEQFQRDQIYALRTGQDLHYYEHADINDTVQEDDIPLIQERLRDQYFVKIRVKLENINAISYLSQFNGRYPLDHPDDSYARDYDFDIMQQFWFFAYSPDRSYDLIVQINPQYFSAEGEEYPESSNEKRGWIYLPPGESKTFELGAFVPRRVTLVPRSAQVDEKEAEALPYYCFGSGCMNGKAFVHLGFGESSDTDT